MHATISTDRRFEVNGENKMLALIWWEWGIMGKISLKIVNSDAYFDNWVTETDRGTGSEGWGQCWVMRCATLAIIQWNVCVCVCDSLEYAFNAKKIRGTAAKQSNRMKTGEQAQSITRDMHRLPPDSFRINSALFHNYHIIHRIIQPVSMCKWNIASIRSNCNLR